jgi:Tfp pilus assembly protein PilN
MINLLPDAVKQDVRYAKLNVTVLQYTILIILISISLVAILLFGVSVVSSDEQALQENIEDKQAILTTLQPTIDEAKDLETAINTIGALFEREVSFSELLQDIGSVIPEGASLSSLSLTGNEEEPLLITAEVSTQATAAILRENLEKSDLFSGADIQSISVAGISESGNPTSYTATLVTQLESEAQ